MADVLALKNNDESESIDLLDGTYKLRDLTWMTGTPQPSSDFDTVPYGAHPAFQNYLTQVETMDLIAQDTTHSTIRAAQRDISEALEAGRLYNQHPLWSVISSTSGTNPWWLHWNIDGETEKRSLIYEGSLAGINEQCADPFIYSDVSLLRMAVIRHPFWEPRAVDSEIIGTTTISCWAGTYDFTAIPGDVWARLRKVELYGKTGKGPVYRTWMGIREEMAGTTNFEPMWELEDGIAYGGAVDTDDVDAASPGSGSGRMVQKVSPAATLTKYVAISVDEVCQANSHTDYAHQIGEYLVLCRYEVDSGTVGLQMRYGYSTGLQIPAEEVFVTATANKYRLVELGRISIPPTGGDPSVTGSYARYTQIEIWAEQVSGTSTINLDALVLVPTHHFWQTSGGSIASSSTNASVVITTPNDKYTCYGWIAYAPQRSLEYSLENWYLPADDSIAVVVGEQEAEHDLDDTVGLHVTYYARWGMYRGLGGT